MTRQYKPSPPESSSQQSFVQKLQIAGEFLTNTDVDDPNAWLVFCTELAYLSAGAALLVSGVELNPNYIEELFSSPNIIELIFLLTYFPNLIVVNFQAGKRIFNAVSDLLEP